MAATPDLVIRAQRVVLPEGLVEKETEIFITAGLISAITHPTSSSERSPNALEAELALPGFVDIHTHGVGGHKEILYYWHHAEYTAKRVIRYGTTSIVASVTFPKNDTEKVTDLVLNTLHDRVGKYYEGCARIDGIHAEGPIVADLGGLVEGESHMSDEQFGHFLDQIGREVKVMTISPSVDAATDYSKMRMLRQRGITVSLGHDKKATEAQILGAIKLGTEAEPVHMTHIFNVQTFHHRDMGLANFGILSKFPRLPQYEGVVEPTVEFIGDLQHLHPLVVQLLLVSKDHTKMACVTDAFFEPDSHETVTYGGRQLEVTRGGADEPGSKVVLKGTTTMAGSCSTQLHMLRSLVKIFGVPLNEASNMLSANPARIVKLRDVGALKVGNRADVLLLSHDDLHLQKTIVSGHVVYDAEANAKS